MEKLPKCLHYLIIMNLDSIDLKSLAHVDKYFYSLLQDEEFWRLRFNKCKLEKTGKTGNIDKLTWKQKCIDYENPLVPLIRILGLKRFLLFSVHLFLTYVMVSDEGHAKYKVNFSETDTIDIIKEKIAKHNKLPLLVPSDLYYIHMDDIMEDVEIMSSRKCKITRYYQLTQQENKKVKDIFSKISELGIPFVSLVIPGLHYTKFINTNKELNSEDFLNIINSEFCHYEKFLTILETGESLEYHIPKKYITLQDFLISIMSIKKLKISDDEEKLINLRLKLSKQQIELVFSI